MNKPPKDMPAALREIKDLRQHLKRLTKAVSYTVKQMGDESKNPRSSPGYRLLNGITILESVNDDARRFGLGEKL